MMTSNALDSPSLPPSTHTLCLAVVCRVNRLLAAAAVSVGGRS